MKLIRMTDDRYILDLGPQATPQQLEEVRNYWEEWWAKEVTTPTSVVVGGNTIPLTYEDRREPDIESRLRRLEEVTGLRSTDEPLGGIEQFQAEDR